MLNKHVRSTQRCLIIHHCMGLKFESGVWKGIVSKYFDHFSILSCLSRTVRKRGPVRNPGRARSPVRARRRSRRTRARRTRRRPPPRCLHAPRARPPLPGTICLTWGTWGTEYRIRINTGVKVLLYGNFLYLCIYSSGPFFRDWLNSFRKKSREMHAFYPVVSSPWNSISMWWNTMPFYAFTT